MPRTRQPDDPNELALVVQTIRSGLGGCLEWQSESLVVRIRNDPELGLLRPQHIRRDLIEAVRESADVVVQVVEARPEHANNYPFYYKVILRYDDFPFEVFVEMVLNDPDPEYPAVTIVNVHQQRRNG